MENLYIFCAVFCKVFTFAKSQNFSRKTFFEKNLELQNQKSKIFDFSEVENSPQILRLVRNIKPTVSVKPWPGTGRSRCRSWSRSGGTRRCRRSRPAGWKTPSAWRAGHRSGRDASLLVGCQLAWTQAPPPLDTGWRWSNVSPLICAINQSRNIRRTKQGDHKSPKYTRVELVFRD